jgi:hypothetical protein
MDIRIKCGYGLVQEVDSYFDVRDAIRNGLKEELPHIFIPYGRVSNEILCRRIGVLTQSQDIAHLCAQEDTCKFFPNLNLPNKW